ncbi:ribonucleoside-diphosphate reductase 2 alpha chain [Atlantibacter hermannii]|nr:ribonucleoside-diphosphate reductase 2 alpha chain [Atlantibacter hermannii]
MPRISARTVDIAVRALTAVSDMSQMRSVPSVEAGNRASHAIGLGQMNLHGYLAREGIAYGSAEGLDFTNIYFLHRDVACPEYLHAVGKRAQYAVCRI